MCMVLLADSTTYHRALGPLSLSVDTSPSLPLGCAPPVLVLLVFLLLLAQEVAYKEKRPGDVRDSWYIREGFESLLEEGLTDAEKKDDKVMPRHIPTATPSELV